MRLVNMIPVDYSGESDQNSQPSLATYPEPLCMAAAVITSVGQGNNVGLFLTRDGGTTWSIKGVRPNTPIFSSVSLGARTNPQPDSLMWTLYGALLLNWPNQSCDQSHPGPLTVFRLRKFPLSGGPTPTTDIYTRAAVDQPRVEVMSFGQRDRVYVGFSDAGVQNGRTASVAVSPDSGATFRLSRIEVRDTGNAGRDGVEVPVSVARDGTAYAAFQGWRKYQPAIAYDEVTSDVVVVRDDNGAVAGGGFKDLLDPDDGLVGLRVVKGVIVKTNVDEVFQCLSTTISLAVDQARSSTVYLAWADRPANDPYSYLRLRMSVDRGASWSDDIVAIQGNIPNSALAVAPNGTVGLLYQRLRTEQIPWRWDTVLWQFKVWGHRLLWGLQTETLIASVPANPQPQNPPTTPVGLFTPYMGDYVSLRAVGNEFRGVFAANNYPDMTSFPQGVQYQRHADFTNHVLLDANNNPVPISIDPFFFGIPVI